MARGEGRAPNRACQRKPKLYRHLRRALLPTSRFIQRHAYAQPLLATIHNNLHRIACVMAVKNVGNVLRGLDILIVDFDDQVSTDVDRSITEIRSFTSTTQAGTIGGASRHYLLH